MTSLVPSTAVRRYVVARVLVLSPSVVLIRMLVWRLMVRSSRTSRSLAPPRIYLREDAILQRVDRWLCKAFAPHRVAQTIDDMYADQVGTGHDAKAEIARAKIAQAETKMARYRAALEAGGDPEEIGKWIAEAKVERVRAEAELRTTTRSTRMSREEITTLVAEIGDMARAIAEGPTDRKSEVYQRLGLRLTYHPGKAKVRAEVNLSPHMVKRFVSEGRHPRFVHAVHGLDDTRSA
ncbi:hypothetical protein [Sphaerisporangium sp. NPDC051011]|uniref:hypothetical protein n=1 Tax=Sphaerisporangium sp. NPDC051011 TaxID=3155792 RepID=UPI0033CBA750